MANPWIQNRIKKINGQIDNHEENRADQDHPLHDWEIALQRRVHHQPPHTRPGKHGFNW
ncbi:MAG: hypothetical protein MZU97_08265 [Bacillus subtilis]|nr:hypothetical protein [Bacillus subtilis]